MAGDGLKWDGLLKWSVSHADGTRPPRNLRYYYTDPFALYWTSPFPRVLMALEELLLRDLEKKSIHTVDVVKRMKEITLVMKTPEDVLEAQGVKPEDIVDCLFHIHYSQDYLNLAEMLDELQEHVESIDMANDLHSIGGLVPLLGYLKNSDSALIRNNKAGIAAFRLANGYAGLRDALGSNSNNLDCNIVTELGLPRLMVHLASCDDSNVREAALGGLLELARDRTSGSSTVVAEEDKLKQILQNRIEEISSMSAEDLGAAREERQLVDSLWNTCYNEPSSLREKGLMVLPGEEAPQPPPDVAGKIFEPPLRAWAASKQLQKGGSNSAEDEKQAKPLLLGPGPVGSSSSSNH
ncbi:hypothetical protein BHM03_00018770 [Ensete ventricosum]|nr:hypothetical protein BHM03_00018770 [Ensete ventricosum]